MAIAPIPRSPRDDDVDLRSCAREGMFLPLLEASERDDGRELVGNPVHLFSDGAMRYTYRMTDVVRMQPTAGSHATFRMTVAASSSRRPRVRGARSRSSRSPPG